MSGKSQTIGDFTFYQPFQILPVYRMKPVFHMLGKSQTSRDSTFCRPSQILPIYRITVRQKSAPVSPYYEFGGKWKVRQKLNLEHKCNSIYTATWMHTSLCCVVLNTSAFFRSSMQEFLFWKGRSQLKTPYHSSFPLGQEIRDSNHSCFRETPCLLSVIGIGKERNPSSTSPTVQIWAFICREWSQKSETVGKTETLPILQICPRPSQTIGDIYDF